MRATIAFMVPFAVSAAGWFPLEVSLAALAAQNIAMVDLRGDYRVRLLLLLVMTAVFTGSAALGAACSPSLLAAVIATGVMAVCGGVWRHLSTDYGMPLAISSMLVFLIALALPHGEANVAHHALAAFLGSGWGVVVQTANWLFRAQHPLRRSVADSWIAVAELIEALLPKSTAPLGMVTAEVNLRAAVDSTYTALAAARESPLRTRLETLNLAGARLATRVVALNTALEPVVATAPFASLVPVLGPALESLGNLARSIGVTTVSRQPDHLALSEVRVRRATNLLRVFRLRLLAEAPDAIPRSQLAEILRQIEQLLPVIQAALQATTDHREGRVFTSLELRDLRTLTLRPLAASLNLTTHVNPALLRFTIRVAFLTMGGVILFKAFGLPHGYWLPFTIVVVLQPDYGSTRQRAFQRTLGTIGGSLVASGLLLLPLPFGPLLVATGATIFAFGYFLKRNYAIAVFFITIFIVLLTEAGGPVPMAFTVERVLSTLAGGILALTAAAFFWPVWERDRFPAFLAAALRANAVYLRTLADRLAKGGLFEGEVILSKRRAEAANNHAFASLQRMSADPRNRQDGLEHAATLANTSQRVTRALSVLGLHLSPTELFPAAALQPYVDPCGQALETIAQSVEQKLTDPAALVAARMALRPTPGLERAPPFSLIDAQRNNWVLTQLGRVGTELAAMLLAIEDAAPARRGDSEA